MCNFQTILSLRGCLQFYNVKVEKIENNVIAISIISTSSSEGF